MYDVIKVLAESLSTQELTTIVRNICCNMDLSDNTVRIYASALALSWMDTNDVVKLAKELDSEPIVSPNDFTMR